MQIMLSQEEVYKVASLNHQSSFSIDRLIENIGADESRDLLIESLPIIQSRKQAILSALVHGDIEAACVCAHKTTGSIRLYGSSRLEALLLEVTTLPVDQPPRSNLQHELAVEFDLAIFEIQQRLKLDLS